MPTALTRRDLLMCMVEPTERAPVRSPNAEAENFVATANGAAGGTTIVAAALTGATADVYVGQLVQCVGPDTSANFGLVKEVVAFDPVTDTLTIDAMPAQVASGDQFIMLDPPDPYFANDTAVDTTHISDASRTQGTDYWNDGDYAIARVAVGAGDAIPEGTARAITAFDAAADDLTTAAWQAIPQVGDLFHARAPLKTWGPAKVTVAMEDLPQLAQRGDFSTEKSIRGSRGGTVEFAMPWKGQGTAAGDGVAANPSSWGLHRLLQAIFATSASTGALVVAQAGTSPANSSTVFNVATGQLTRFPVGSLCMHAGRVAVVTATAANGIDPDSVTVNPAFGRTPTVGETIYGGYAYQPQMTGHLTMTFENLRGMQRRDVLYGCLPTIKIVGFARNAVPNLQFNYRSAFAYATKPAQGPTVTATHETVQPISANDSYVMLDATTRLLVDEWSVDLGLEISEEPVAALPNGIYGLRITGWKPIVTLVLQLDDTSPNNSNREADRFLSSDSFSFMGQVDRRPGHTKAFYAHSASYLSPTVEPVDNMHRLSCRAEINPSGLASMPDWLFGTV